MLKARLLFVAAFLLVIFFCQTAWAGYAVTISKTSNKLALYQYGQLLRVFPVATGRSPALTPEGTFTITCKLVDPYYSRGQIPGGSPNNPLGPRWLGLSIGGGGTYGIHGTNNPASIGRHASSGCIRMYNQDVIWLFNQVPTGTPVTITSKPLAVKKKKDLKEPPVLLVGTKKINLDTYQQDNGPPLIPLQRTAELLGYRFTWHAKYQVIELVKGNIKRYLDPAGNCVLVNGVFYRLPVSAQKRDGEYYLPLDFFRLLPELVIDWDAKSRQVKIEMPGN